MKPFRGGLSKQQRRALRIRTGVGRRYRVSPQRRRRKMRQMSRALARTATAAARLSAALVVFSARLQRFAYERAVSATPMAHTGGVILTDDRRTVLARRDTLVGPRGSDELRRVLREPRRTLGPSGGGAVLVIDRHPPPPG